MANDIVNYQDVITAIKGIISSGREVAYNAANKAMVLTYWHVGKRIVEQEQAGKESVPPNILEITPEIHKTRRVKLKV